MPSCSITESVCGRSKHLTEGQPAADGTTATIDLDGLQSLKGILDANVTLSPGPGRLDPVTGLKEDVSMAVHSAATPTKRTWTELHRSPSTKAFAAVIVGVLISE